LISHESRWHRPFAFLVYDNDEEIYLKIKSELKLNMKHVIPRIVTMKANT